MANVAFLRGRYLGLAPALSPCPHEFRHRPCCLRFAVCLRTPDVTGWTRCVHSPGSCANRSSTTAARLTETSATAATAERPVPPLAASEPGHEGRPDCAVCSSNVLRLTVGSVIACSGRRAPVLRDTRRRTSRDRELGRGKQRSRTDAGARHLPLGSLSAGNCEGSQGPPPPTSVGEGAGCVDASDRFLIAMDFGP